MSEGLYIPEEHLEEVMNLIRFALKKKGISRSVKSNLKEWCSETEEYLKELKEEEQEDEKPKKRTIKKKR